MLGRLCIRNLALLRPAQPQFRMAMAAYTNNSNGIIAAQQRAFAKKGRKKKADGTTTDEEALGEEPEQPVAQPVQQTQASSNDRFKEELAAAKNVQFKEVPKELFKPFTVGDVNKVQTTPDHKPPTQDDTMDGRYASVLFTTASQQEALYTIYEDFVYLRQLYDGSESFRLFTQNAGVGLKEIQKFN